MNNDASHTKHTEQYKAYLQDLGNIGTRHENSRRFYLTVVSAIFVFLSLAGKDAPLKPLEDVVITLVGMAGILLCLVWILHMQAFGAIYKAKFDVIRALEKNLGLYHIYAEEFEYLKADPRYYFLVSLDSVIPALFGGMFTALLLYIR